jgi:hypothetical protein
MDVFAWSAQLASETDDVMRRNVAIVAHTEEVAEETTVLMKGQTEQMKSIYANLKDMDSELKRAEKITKHFLRRLMTDKITICLVLLLVAVIVGLLVWRFVQSRSQPAPTPSSTPSP